MEEFNLEKWLTKRYSPLKLERIKKALFDYEDVIEILNAAKEKQQGDKHSEQFKCHSCGTNHSGKNDDQLFEVCKTCFDGI